MPELPEVETMRRGILRIVGSRIERAERTACHQKPIHIAPRIDAFHRRVRGKRVRDVGRAGKRVVLWLDSDDAIVLEPRMTGLVLVADPPDRTYLRFRCELSGNGIREVLYWDRRGLGSVRLFSAESYATAFGPDKLGPDALGMTAALLRDRLGVSRRAIKVALLDQRAVAGIGNLYASEILHVARIHPARPCDRFTKRQWHELVDATHHVLEEAILHEGSTLSDGTYRNALNENGGYQKHHRVYDRAGMACPDCGASIVRMVQTQRATFFCPQCQRKG